MVTQVLLLLEPLQAWARAGGAGGGHGSFGGGHSSGFSDGGGGGDGIFYLIVTLLRAGPIGWIILAIIAFVAYKFYTGIQVTTSSEITISPSHYHNPTVSGARQFSEAFPADDYSAFQNKVNKAFLTIQQSWSEKSLSHMRRFISDGVYQRFNAQFTMMNLLVQSNPISEVQVFSVETVKTERDGAYDCVDVLIRASATDQFVCEKFPELNSPGGNEAFAEYWTFIRRTDHRPGRDIYHSEQCPQCAAPLNAKLMETARCPYCGTYLNSGEFDWVLAEITQENDYGMGVPGLGSRNSVDLSGLRQIDPGFSAHVLEDKATNAFMEILIGNATNQAALVKRFATEELSGALSLSAPKSRIAYDRLYTNAVELLKVEVSGEEAKAFVAIRYSAHQVDLSHPLAAPLGMEPFPTVSVLSLVRNYGEAKAKGSVYAGSCPHCGAPQKDNLSPLCDHCGMPLNDSDLDWIVSEVLSATKYREKLPATTA